MRPLPLLQWSGRRSPATSGQTLHEAFPDRFAVSDNLGRIAESGQAAADRDGALDPALAAGLEVGRTRRPAAGT